MEKETIIHEWLWTYDFEEWKDIEYISPVSSVINTIIPTTSANQDETAIVLRKERLNFCKSELYKLVWEKLPRDLVLNKYNYEIYWQEAITRCATFATLIYARESDDWKWWGPWSSYRCKAENNCYWNNWHHFRSKSEYVEHFAKTYWKYNRHTYTVSNFVKNYMCWSTCVSYEWRIRDKTLTLSQKEIDERYWNYINFLNENYWEVYNELKNLK